jgi:DnaJ-class molecular chaperone
MQDQIEINGVKVVATHLPFRCPVCNGFGTLKRGLKQCQGCHGSGYVVVEQGPAIAPPDDGLSTYPQSYPQID